MPRFSIKDLLVSTMLVAVGLTPFIYLGHAFVERKLGIKPVVLGENGEPLAEPVQAPPAEAPSRAA